MSAPGHNSADARLRSFIDRVLRLKEEQDALAADIREVYAEAKGEGYDKTAMGALVAHLRKVEKKGSAAIEEASTVFDLYLDAYQRASGTPIATHTHEKFPPHAETGELADTPSVQSETTVVSAYAGTASEENPAPIQESEPAHAVRSDDSAPSVAGTVLQAVSEPAARSSDESAAPYHETPAEPSMQATAAGEVPSSQASPATIQADDDFDPIRDIPAHLRRTDAGCMGAA